MARAERRLGRALLAAALLGGLVGCHHGAAVPDKPMLEAEPLAGKPARPAKPVSPPPVVHAEPPPGVTHQVQPGETMFRIARAYGVTPEELAAANPDVNPKSLSVGTRLLIPNRPQALPVPAPELDGAAVEEGVVIQDEPASGPAHAPGCTGPRCLAWPLRGVIYGRFGSKAGEQAGAAHEGLDLAAPEGTPISAAAAGTVLYAGEQKGYGTLVILQHDDGLITLYAHNRENLVKEGARVAQGQVIARVGTSGRTSGPHVHFEVRKGTKPVDPMPLLPSPARRASAAR